MILLKGAVRLQYWIIFLQVWKSFHYEQCVAMFEELHCSRNQNIYRGSGELLFLNIDLSWPVWAAVCGGVFQKIGAICVLFKFVDLVSYVVIINDWITSEH